jgi:hypothetical protein
MHVLTAAFGLEHRLEHEQLLSISNPPPICRWTTLSDQDIRGIEKVPTVDSTREFNAAFVLTFSRLNLNRISVNRE